MKPIIETLKDFIEFLKNPADQPDAIQTAQQKTKRLFSLLALDIIAAAIILVIVAGIEKLGLLSMEEHKVVMMFEDVPIWLLALMTVAIIPLLEELIFRLPLRFKYNYFIRSIILLSSIAGKENKIKVETRLNNFWAACFRWIFFIIATIFGLIHLLNYEFSMAVLLFAPILIAPQFIAGLGMGYLRVKYSFILGLFFHSISNAILLAVSLIFMNIAVEKLNIENENYSIKIEEVSPREKSSFYNFSMGDDKISFGGRSLKLIICDLLGQEEYSVKTNNPKLARTKMNLVFSSHSKDFESRELILKYLSDLYDFDIETEKIIQEAWELEIRNAWKLMEYKSTSNTNDYSKTTTSEKEIKFENANLQAVAHTLASNYDKRILCSFSNDATDRYNFTIPKIDFEALKDLLYSEYGLALEMTTQKLEYTNINFKK